MAPTSLSLSAPNVPSCAQVALAIAVIRSKPPGTSMRDHVLGLRVQVKQGQCQCQCHAQDQCHHVDFVAYWQKRCTRLQDECNRLRSVNIRLERSNQLLANGPSGAPDTSVLSPRSSMCKVGTTSRAKTARRPKSLQRKTAQQAIAETRNTIESDSDFLDTLGEDGASLTESLFITHNLFRATAVDVERLCFSLVQTSSMLGKVICAVTQNFQQLSRERGGTLGVTPLDHDKSKFTIAISVCARAFMSVLVGTKKLAESNVEKRLSSLIVCELADMFKAALNAVELSAQQTAQGAMSQPFVSKNGEAKVPTNLAKESVPARSIAHLLISFLGFLDKTDSIHQKIFDGFVFVLLERVGKRLYYCTFGRHRGRSIESSIIPLPRPRDITETTNPDLEDLAVRLEMKALVLILERAMGLAPNHMNVQATRTGKNRNHLGRAMSIKNLSATSKTRISPLAKDRLQRTLVACMYESKTDDEFVDVLVNPIPTIRASSLQNVAKVDHKNVKDWYKQEVWRLVGWDILAREREW